MANSMRQTVPGKKRVFGTDYRIHGAEPMQPVLMSGWVLAPPTIGLIGLINVFARMGWDRRLYTMLQIS
jgi:hypothetical protein